MWAVFERKPSSAKTKQISILLETESDAQCFIETMQCGINYRTLHADYELFYSEIKT